jgi:hypothetical protein
MGHVAVQGRRHARCAGGIEVDAGPRERGKSLNDYGPNDFSLNDGSVGFIWAWTAEL